MKGKLAKNQINNDFSCISTLPPNSFIFNIKNNPVIIIDEKGFSYNGQLIEDAGEIYKAFMEFFKMNKNES